MSQLLVDVIATNLTYTAININIHGDQYFSFYYKQLKIFRDEAAKVVKMLPLFRPSNRRPCFGPRLRNHIFSSSCLWMRHYKVNSLGHFK
jgi:hypothetical protein